VTGLAPPKSSAPRFTAGAIFDAIRCASSHLNAGARATEHAARDAEQSYSSALAGMRELNMKLIEMAHDNTEAVFELAHEIASAEAEIWAERAAGSLS